MKIFYFLSLILTVSCSTDLPLKYRSAGDFSLKENTFISIAPNNEKVFLGKFQKAIIDDGWLKLAPVKESNYYEIIFSNIKTEELPINSSTRDGDGKKIRSIVCRASGSGTFTIKINKDKTIKSFDFSAEGMKTSELEMPKEHGQNSLWPLLNLMSGYNEVDQVSSIQNLNCSLDAIQDLHEKMAQEALNKIVPSVKKINIVIEDSESDMKPIEGFIKNEKFNEAYNYLLSLLAKEKRSDIYYNLGVIQEARRKYPESCENYKKAIEISDKKLYSTQLDACTNRQASYDKLK